MYSFKPITEEGLELYSLLEEGTYDFEVLKATRKTSKQNNPMAELQLMICSNNGSTQIVYDYLVFSQVPLNIRKVKHFCEAVGLEEEYKKGEIPENLEGLNGKVKIAIQKGSEIPQDKLFGKPEGTCYPNRNVVIDYIFTEHKVAKLKSLEPLTDDLPF